MSITSSSSSRAQNQLANQAAAHKARRRRSRGVSAIALAAASVPVAGLVVQEARADINGFGDGSGWSINTSGVYTPVFNSPTDLTITDQQNSEANSVFFGTAQSIVNFTTSFQYKFNGGSGNPADGVAFVIQNAPTGTSALGGGGGGLGYGGMTNSAAFEINIYQPNTRGVATNVNGGTGGYSAIPGINWLDTSNPVSVTLQYNGTYLTETISQGANSFTGYVMADLTLPVGGTSALVGFTGGTGGENSEQHILNFSFAAGTNTAVTLGPDYHWIAGNDNWTNTAAWNPPGSPGSNAATLDNAFIDNVAGGTAHVTTVVANPMNSLVIAPGNHLSVDSGGSLTFIGSNGAQVAVGQPGNGRITVNGGTLTIANGDVNLGAGAGSDATFTVSSGDYVQYGGGWFTIGRDNGTGHGQADGVGGTGTFNMTGGTFTHAVGDTIVGAFGGTGVLNQSGGVLNHSSGNWFNIGRNGGTGVYNMNGGTANVGSMVIAGNDSGNAALTTLGTLNVSNGATINVNTGDMIIGARGGSIGVVNMTGGTVNAGLNGGWIYVGQAGGTGTFNLSGGTLNHATGDTIVGADPGTVGTLNQTGGVINHGTNGNWFNIGRHGGTGVYNLSAGTANIGSDTVIGAADDGTTGTVGIVNQTGGIYNQNGGWFNIGARAGNEGTYNISNATYNGAAGTWMVVGREGSIGTFNMSNGANVHVGGEVDVGQGSNGGIPGSGTINLTGGVMSVSNDFNLARDTATNGDLNVSGTTVLTVGGWMRVGSANDGGASAPASHFNMSSGSVSVSGRLMVGVGGVGIMNMSGGVVNVGDTGDAFDLGDNNGGAGVGTVNHTGGTINVAGDTVVGNWGTDDGTGHGFGTYNMSNGATLNTGGIRIGHENNATANIGDGVFNQTGGNVNLRIGGNSVRIGAQGSTLSGTYSISGGTLSLNGAGAEVGGGNGSKGTFDISGGLVNAQNSGGGILVQPNGVLNWTGGTLTAGVTVNGGAANMSTMPALRMEPGGVLRINSGTANLPTSGVITTDNGGVVINNNGAAMNTTALNISASNASQVVFNPGTGSTYTAIGASTININGSSLHAKTGLVDLSNVTVNASGSNTFFTTGQFAGLLEGWVQNPSPNDITNDNNLNNIQANPGQGGVQLTPRFGTTINAHSDALGAGVVDPRNKVWGNQVTVVYSGQMFVPAATPVVAFGEAVDDATVVKIDGVEVMHDETWNNSTSSGSNVLSPGWHDVEFRFGQGGGGAGPDGQGGWPGNKGFGIQFGTSTDTFDTKNDGTGAAATSTASLYTIPVDNGSQNLFRFIGTVMTQGADVTVDEGSELRIGHITGSAPLLLNGLSGGTVGATLTFPTASVATSQGLGDIVLTATNSLGTLNLGSNNTLNATNVTVPTGSTFTVNGPGKLNVSGTTSISDNAVMHFGTNATHVTHTTGSLVITTSTNTGGLLDLGNSFLITDNALTSEAQIRTYLHNGYNADASGIGNWLGKGGITSSDAIKSHNGPSPDFHVSVGYVNGAYALDPLIGGSIPGQESLPTNRTLIRPALYGDLNLDGKVDDTDLQIFSGLGQYNQPTDKFGWLGGDLNHDGKVDDTDLQIFSGAGNYNGPTYGAASGGASHASATPSATPSLTGHVEANGDIVLSAATTQGTAGDGVLDFVYDPSTGHLTLSYDGDPRVTSAQPFQVVRFKSAGSHFIPANFNGAAFGAGVTATTAALNGTASGSNSVPDGYDMGAVLPTGLAVSDLTSDLTLQWNVFGGGLTLKNGDVIVPEPTTLGLIGLGAAGLLARRRRNRRSERQEA